MKRKGLRWSNKSFNKSNNITCKLEDYVFHEFTRSYLNYHIICSFEFIYTMILEINRVLLLMYHELLFIIINYYDFSHICTFNN